MEEKPKVEVSPVQMKAIARYELDFRPFLTLPDGTAARPVFPETVPITLEDLDAALKNLAVKDPTMHDFGEYWYFPLAETGDSFCLEDACGGEDPAEVSAAEHGLPLQESDVFLQIWEELEDFWSEDNDTEHVTDILPIPNYLQRIARFQANRTRPLSEKIFTDEEKEHFLRDFDSDSALQAATAEERSLCRRFTDELCAKGNWTALRMKGYACYGGNCIYPCDWKASRDCLLRLFQSTDDPQLANTLGYIYYYGRCTEGRPEYEKAFEMFSLAAANGIYEGTYKLADMYCHGYACRRSVRTARTLYNLVYEDCYRKFLKGVDGNFADAALRLGNVCLKGIGMAPDPEAAYGYLLQADYAAGLRAAHGEYFGDSAVRQNIQCALKEAREKLPEDYGKEYDSAERPWQLYELVKDRWSAVLSVAPGEKNACVLKAKRVPARGATHAEPVLLTVPPVGYCELTEEVTLTAMEASVFLVSMDSTIRYDSCEWNYADQRTEFYEGENMTGWIASDEYRFSGRK